MVYHLENTDLFLFYVILCKYVIVDKKHKKILNSANEMWRCVAERERERGNGNIVLLLSRIDNWIIIKCKRDSMVNFKLPIMRGSAKSLNVQNKVMIIWHIYTSQVLLLWSMVEWIYLPCIRKIE